LTCSCPASRANLSVTYAHVAAHPQVQIGRLTSRLPSFSCWTVMLWVTLVMVSLPPEEFLHSLRPACVYCGAELTATTIRRPPGVHCLAVRARGTSQATGRKPHTLGPYHTFERRVSQALVSGVSTAHARCSSPMSDRARLSRASTERNGGVIPWWCRTACRPLVRKFYARQLRVMDRGRGCAKRRSVDPVGRATSLRPRPSSSKRLPTPRRPS
jgi:hypothetical protein